MDSIRRLVVVASILLLLPAAAFAAPQVLRGEALVIGESKYAALPALTNPVSDARAIDDMLTDLGFRVDRVLEARGSQIQQRVDQFTADATGADVVIVYYSGHGVEIGGRNYVMGIDGDVSTPETAAASLIPIDDVIASVEKAAPIIIVLLDACRTSPFPSGEMIQLPGAAAPQAISSAGLAVIVRGPDPAGRPAAQVDGMVIGFSASPGQAALDGEPGGNSPYAAALLKHLIASGYSFADVMTLVSEEVYVTTRARQLPWTNSSLKRILYFGQTPAVADTDEQSILNGRRQLLLKIASTPEQSRQIVEAVANGEQIDLASVYAMLESIDSSKGELSEATQQKLTKLVEQVNRTLSDPLLPGTPSDPELARLDKLATQAIAEGTIDLALKYRKQEAVRAKQLERQLDAQQVLIDAQRRELGGVYARVAETALMALDNKTEDSSYKAAVRVIGNSDKSASVQIRLRQADKLANTAMDNHDLDTTNKAIAAYKDLLDEVDRTTTPFRWAHIQSQLATLETQVSWRNNDRAYAREAYDRARDALTIYTPQKNLLEWFAAMNVEAEAMGQIGMGDFGLSLLQEVADTMPRKMWQWWGAQMQLGHRYYWNGRSHSNLEHALDAFQTVLPLIPRNSSNVASILFAEERVAELTYELAVEKLDRDAMKAAALKGVALEARARKLAGKNEQAWVGRALGQFLMEAGQTLRDVKIATDGIAIFSLADWEFTLKNGASTFIEHATLKADAQLFVGVESKSTKILRQARANYAAALDAAKTLGDTSLIAHTTSRLKAADAALERLAKG